MRLSGLNNKRCLDLRNKKFGKLTAINIDSSRRDRIYWICHCDCGNSKSVASKHLVKMLITSCGCHHHKKGKENPRWKGYEEISGKYWESLKHGAKQRELKFDITMKYAWDIFINQNRQCALTGIPLMFGKMSGSTDGNASLDRIDSSKGYVEGNIQWVEKKINTIKWDLSVDNFLKMCKMVVEHKKL